MTDTTKAPERLYFYDDWLAKNTKGKLLCGNNEYIRADLVNELIAAAYEDAAEVAFGSFATGTGLRDEILAQAPDAARAALEPVTVRICQKCGHPENNHPYRHMFVALIEKDQANG